jgi:two-component system OmpR family response regulator
MCIPHCSARLSVLVVDDYPDAAEVTADLLGVCGHRVTVAHSALEALAAADREPPDVALLDLRLPDLDGWQVARRLREQARGRDGSRLLVAVSGCGADADRWRSVEAGIDLHLLKPADPQFLIGMLKRFALGGERPADGEGG